MTHNQELRIYFVVAVLAYTGLAIVIALAIVNISCILGTA